MSRFKKMVMEGLLYLDCSGFQEGKSCIMAEIMQRLQIQSRLCPSIAVVRFFRKSLGGDQPGQGDYSFVLKLMDSTSKWKYVPFINVIFNHCHFLKKNNSGIIKLFWLHSTTKGRDFK